MKITQIEELEPSQNVETVNYYTDDEATWVYWTLADAGKTSIAIEALWERLRIRRNELLSATDFRVLADAPWQSEPWLVYRQALRDLPQNTIDPRQAVWPELPTV